MNARFRMFSSLPLVMARQICANGFNGLHERIIISDQSQLGATGPVKIEIVQSAICSRENFREQTSFRFIKL